MRTESHREKRQPWVDRSKDWDNASVICRMSRIAVVYWNLEEARRYSLYVLQREHGPDFTIFPLSRLPNCETINVLSH